MLHTPRHHIVHNDHGSVGDEVIQLRGYVNLMHWRDIRDELGLGRFYEGEGGGYNRGDILLMEFLYCTYVSVIIYN